MTKILYVEDNPDNVYMLTRRLKKKGFELIIAGDGQEGIDKAIEEKPDLILMDLSLPTMDGWTATAKIKEMEQDVLQLSANRNPIAKGGLPSAYDWIDGTTPDWVSISSCLEYNYALNSPNLIQFE